MTLKEKYGDEMVLAIPSRTVVCKGKGKGPGYWDDDIEFCTKKGVAKYRWEAETDPSYKQLVVYATIHSEDFKTFVTHRLAGDSRLTGKHSIGTGGHVAPDESMTEALFRELREEVGLEVDDMILISRVGYILDNSSDVNSVHLGVVYDICVRDKYKVQIRETEKLAGEWMDENSLAKLFHEGKLESWSEIAYMNAG